MRIFIGVLLTLAAYTYGHLMGLIDPVRGLILGLGILGLDIIAVEIVIGLRDL